MKKLEKAEKQLILAGFLAIASSVYLAAWAISVLFREIFNRMLTGLVPELEKGLTAVTFGLYKPKEDLTLPDLPSSHFLRNPIILTVMIGLLLLGLAIGHFADRKQQEIDSDYKKEAVGD